MEEMDSIRPAIQMMFDAMVSKDADSLRNILSDDMRLYHMSGMCQSREDFIGDILDGSLDYHRISIVSMDADVKDDHADVCVRTKTDASVYGGQRHTWRLQMDTVMKKRNGRWMATESRASVF